MLQSHMMALQTTVESSDVFECTMVYLWSQMAFPGGQGIHIEVRWHSRLQCGILEDEDGRWMEVTEKSDAGISGVEV